MPEAALKPQPRGSIIQRLTRRLLTALVLLAFAAGIVVYWQARSALQTQFDASLRVRAETLAAFLECKAGRVELDLSDQPARGNADADFIFEARTTGGTPVKGSPALGVFPPDLFQAPVPVYRNLQLPSGRPGRAVAITVRVQDEDSSPSSSNPAEAVMVVAANREPLLHTLQSLQWVLATGGLLLLLATFIVVPRILHREFRPLREIAAQAAAIDSNSLSVRFAAANAPDEVAAITARLNDLLSRLEDSFARERRFSSDLAHEFRTPIAELRSFAELSLKLPQDRPANADQEILNISLHLERMLTDLLMLARGEQEDISAALEPVDVAALVAELCQKFEARARQRQLSLQLRAPGQLVAVSHPVLLQSILTNLIDNAVEYASAGEVVSVQVEDSPDGISVRVTNPTHELTQQDIPRLFERFWRKDPARGANGHTGLGLALAQTFARKLGCELTAAFSSPGHLTVSLVSNSGAKTFLSSATSRQSDFG